MPAAVTDFQTPFYETDEYAGISMFQPKMETDKKKNILEKKFEKFATFDIKVKDEPDNSLNLSKIDDTVTQKSMDISRSHFIVQDESDINQYYRNMDIKIFKDIIFIENKQCMIVKTWEKLQHIYTKDICFIKTLRIFDNHNHIIH